MSFISNNLVFQENRRNLWTVKFIFQCWFQGKALDMQKLLWEQSRAKKELNVGENAKFTFHFFIKK